MYEILCRSFVVLSGRIYYLNVIQGLDADLKAKRDANYDPKLEAEAKQWVESVTGEHLGSSLHAVSGF